MRKTISLILSVLLMLSVIPAFSANLPSDLVSTAASVFTSKEPQYSSITGGYDRNKSTVVYVGAESATVGGWFAVEFASPSVVTSIGVKTRPNNSLGEFAGFVFELANERDFSDAVTVYSDTRTASELSYSQDIKYIHNDIDTTYKYARIRRIGVTVICFAEFYVEGYGFDEVNLTTLSTTIPTSKSEPLYGSYAGAIDGKSETFIYLYDKNAPLWYMVDFGEPCIISSVSLKNRSSGDTNINKIKIEVSNDSTFENATEIYCDETTAWGYGEGPEFELNSGRKYRYLRVSKLSAGLLCFADLTVKGYNMMNSNYSESITVNAQGDTFYAVSFDAMAGVGGATVNITNNSVPVRNITLSNPGLGKYTKHYAVLKLKAGDNTIVLNHSTGRALIMNFYVLPLENLTDDIVASFVADVNSSQSAFILKDRMNEYFEIFGINKEEIEKGIFYDIPLYECMVDKDYNSSEDIINSLFENSVKERNDLSVTVTRDGEIQNEFSSGDYVVNVKNIRISDVCKVVAAVYEGNRLLAAKYDVPDSTGNVSIPLSVNASGREDVNFRLFYLSDFDTLRPIDAYPDVYEHIYMSENGSDYGDGSKDNPFATLDAVKTRIADINDSMTGNIIVHIEDGIYPVTETLSFTEEHGGKNGYSVIITGDGSGNNPVFTGGVKVTGWQDVGNGIYRAPLDVNCDVRNLYINGYGAVRAKSSYKYELEEFFDNEETTYSRDGFYTSIYGIPAFSKPDELELVWNISWQTHRTPVESMEEVNGRYLFHMTNPCFSIEHHASTDSIALKEGRTFYIENAFELLDEVGEFYHSKSENYIYYKPYPEEILSECEAYIPVTETLFNIGGSSNLSKIKNIVFNNLDIRHGAWNMVSEVGLMGVQADTIYTLGESGTELIPTQFTIRNADGLRIENCNFSDMGSGALGMMDAVTNSSVSGCSFTDISGTGVIVGNPTKSKVTAENKCSDIEITNNIFRRVASEYHQTTAITAYHGNGFIIRNNDIKKVPYTAVNVGWGWETHGENTSGNTYPPDGCGYYDVSHNRIEDSMLVLKDGASIYSLDHGPTAIKDNYILNSCGPQQFGIYLDSSARNTIVADNVVEDSQRWLNVAGSYISNITARNNYYTIPISNYLSTVNVVDNRLVSGEYPFEAESIIADSGAKTQIDTITFDTPSWRKESIYTIPKHQNIINGCVREAVLFDDCYDPTTQIVDTRLSTISFNKDEWVSYELPPLVSGTYKLTVTASRVGTGPATFKVYVNNPYFASLTGEVAETGAWGVYADNECGNLRLYSSSNTIRFKVTSGAFEFYKFRLDKID